VSRVWFDAAGKTVVVGQAPSVGRSRKPPLSGKSGQRLEALAGLAHGELGSCFALTNLLGRYPGRGTGGDRFPHGMAARAARKLRGYLAGRRAILLGSGVARAFQVPARPFFEWRQSNGLTFMVVPHPSGLNRWWNDPANLALAERALRGVARCAA